MDGWLYSVERNFSFFVYESPRRGFQSHSQVWNDLFDLISSIADYLLTIIFSSYFQSIYSIIIRY